MRRAKRRPEGFNIAFLDVMSCGLGAVTLIFMLVKYQTEVPNIENSALAFDIAEIESQTEATLAENNLLEQQLETLTQKINEKEGGTSQTSASIDAKNKEIEQLDTAIAEMKAKIKTQETQVASVETPQGANISPKVSEDHLIGLRVSGDRILILLDSSASMANERLIDIVKTQIADVSAKKSAPKWQRTLRVVNWIMDRVPDNSEYLIVSYNEKARFLHGRQWIKGSDAKERKQVEDALAELHPENATNFEEALRHIRTNKLRPSDIYIITDGLPTKGVGKLSLKYRRALRCKSYSKKDATITSACREALFYSAIVGFSTGRKTKINTVLLPIEGDPNAAFAYWQWNSATGGMMVSPPPFWP